MAALLLIFFWRVLVLVRRESTGSGATSQPTSLGLLDQQSNVIRAFRLSRQRPISIGRDNANDIVLTDRSVSSVHATITYSGRVWILTDMDSRNGTWLEGEQVAGSVEILEGEVIQLGAIRLVLISEESAL